MILKRPKFWDNINFISLILLPFSLITILFNTLKSLVIKENKFNLPIICVGNIFVGGTGKTPLSIYIYNLLKKRGLNPAIVRKYYDSHLDEISLTKNKVKSFFCESSRLTSILNAEKKNNKVIVMDDGLQDISIKKDVNIICFNSSDLIGNGFLIPAGPLRERLRKLKFCQIIVINGKRNFTFEKQLQMISKNIKIYQSIYKIKKIQNLKNKKILAFAGIGNPENFFSLLKSHGLSIKEKISFPDHYNYSKDEIQNIIWKAKKKNLRIITTEKDYFRIKRFGLKKIEHISIEIKIIKNKSFEKDILNNLW